MANLLPPGKPTKGKADDTSGPSGDQRKTEIQGEISILQILAEQEAGKFDLNRDFGKIKNPSEFYRLLGEYEAMNDKHKPCTDFPTDSKTQMQWVLKVVKAICNKERATDATNKKIASARQDEEDLDGRDRPGDEADGNNESIARSENRPSSAVTHLNRLKAAEVEIGSWKVVLSARAAQQNELSRGVFGNPDKLQLEEYNSWTERMNVIIDALESDAPQTSKCVARALFQKGDDYILDFTASPKATLKKHVQNKKSNDGRSDKNAEVKEARRLAESKQKDSSGLSTLAQPLAEAFGHLLAEKKARVPGSALTRGGRQRKHDSSSKIPSAEKQKQPSAVPTTSSAGQRQTQPTVPTGGETWLDTMEERANSAGSPASSPVKRLSKDDHSIPDDADFSDVARPGVHDRDGPATPTETQLPSGPYRFVVPAEFFSTAESSPTSHDAGNEPKPASSTSIDPQAILASLAKYRRRHQPDSRVSNESTAESANEEFSPLVLAPQPSSENDQDPGNPSRFCPPAGGPSALTGSSSSAMQYQTSAAGPQPLQGPSGPFSVAEGSSQNDIPATLDTRSPAKKRQRLSPQAEDDPPPHAHGATATESHKRHKRDSSGSSMDGNVDDLGWDYEDDDDDSSMEGNVDDLGLYYEEDDDDEYYDAEQ